MAIDRTLVVDVQAVIEELNSTRSLMSFQRGIALGTTFKQERFEIAAGGGVVNLSSIPSVIVLYTNVPVKLSVFKDGGNHIDINVSDLFLCSAPLDSITITNENTADNALVGVIVG